jgi:hypothetical protein
MPKELQSRGSKKPTREAMLADLFQVENSLEGYWCEGEKCVSNHTHWVLHSSKTICWECRHNYCAPSSPLVWDESEHAYYRFFLSCNGKSKENIWMLEPTSDFARISFKQKETKRKDTMKTMREEEDCAGNQQNAQNKGLCCHHHTRRMKLKDKEESQMMKQAKVDWPDHCIHCNEDPCVLVQIELHLSENNTIYYDKDEQYENNPVAYNSNRHTTAATTMQHSCCGKESISYCRPHYMCVENSVRALLPPLDGKIMGYKSN